MKYILFVILIFLSQLIAGSSFSVEKIEPPNWWAGMKWNKVQLMIYGNDLHRVEVTINSTDIVVDAIHHVSSEKYLFVDLKISEKTKSGQYILSFKKDSEIREIPYKIMDRDTSQTKHQGFDQSDVIYLITPDRFVNGDRSNDKVDGYDQRFGRDDRLARHGGDIAGIISKLDYLKDLGITALWINPLVENNMFISYHGYSATCFYTIDPRFGSNKLYKKLVEEAHARGIKIILDHVSNHIGDNHSWMKDLPEKSWLNGSKKSHLNAVHQKSLMPDIHAPQSEKDKLLKGWFMDFMPDLNQQNPYLANYLIQNTLWWIEYSGLDGIREDTYPYSDAKFLADWARAILEEYPNFNIVGEVWDGIPATLSYFQTNTPLKREFDTNLPCVTDFKLTYAFGDFLKGRSDLAVIYNALEQDFVYTDPNNLMTFIDNHDILRAAYLSEGINEKLKIALQILLTTRGIPQIYYGAEIGVIGDEDHGDIRADFPGGFPGDKRNAFNKQGRTDEENKLYDQLKQIIKIRTSQPALQFGALIHYPVPDNVYVYKRIYKDEEVVILVNGNDSDQEIQPAKYDIEKNILNMKTGKTENFSGTSYILPAMSVTFWKLLKQ